MQPHLRRKDMPMLLSEILRQVPYRGIHFRDCEIREIVYDSRQAGPDTLFVALPGAFSDGHAYVENAYERGARAFLTQREVDLPDDAAVAVTEDSRRALSIAGATFYGHPERELKIVGVTGTKGKTSIAGMLGACLNSAGVKCGTIGTVGAYFDGKVLPTVNTTPESLECMRLFRTMADAGCKAVVMEVSSLGLKAHRVDGITFEAAIFTNISPDHIGGKEHQGFAEYSYWKKQLFHQCKTAVLNGDDPFSSEIIRELTVPYCTYGVEHPADYVAKNIERTRGNRYFGTAFMCESKEGTYPVETAVPGLFSVYNALAAIAVCRLLGVSIDAAAKGLASATVIGRNDCLKVPADYDVIIDYAHNGRSFTALMDTITAYPHNRIITVFGSVGDRAQLRRQEMGEISGERADLSIITTDDPGYEEPEKICREIASFVERSGGVYKIITDREQAVFYALDTAQPGDIVLLLGKGHETAQKIRGEKVHYSDYETVEKYFREKGRVFSREIS